MCLDLHFEEFLADNERQETNPPTARPIAGSCSLQKAISTKEMMKGRQKKKCKWWKERNWLLVDWLLLAVCGKCLTTDPFDADRNSRNLWKKSKNFLDGFVKCLTDCIYLRYLRILGHWASHNQRTQTIVSDRTAVWVISNYLWRVINQIKV